jgi:hypothetical protein
MPRVTTKTGVLGPDGREEELAEYLCDWPDCPNIATRVLGSISDLGLFVAVCEEHAAGTRATNTTPSKSQPTD